MQEKSPSQRRLRPDASLQFWAKAGSTIRLASGKAYLMSPPRWLAETVVSDPSLLLGGSTHVLTESGWVVIYAITATEVWISADEIRHADSGQWLGNKMRTARKRLDRMTLWRR
ncbi:hypothetical protein ACUHMQ_12310 [Chitinimonas sp. PSY-7]|uniref:hypothetical protein n=1 Tax=Chitinimonas sp. PSY-7 TaxID=3459088 RepID=UPI00404017AB